MVAGKLVSPVVQKQVLTYLECGKDVKWIRKKTGLAQSTIYDIKKRGRVKERNEYKGKHGRPQKMTNVQKDRVRQSLRKNDRLTLRKLRLKHHLKISIATLSRILKKNGIQRRKLKVRPKLKRIHRKKRVDYALCHCHPDFDWSKWIFTDEKKFNLDGPDGYNYYWHFVGDDPKFHSKDSNTRRSVMVWGGISKSGQTPLMEIKGTMKAKDYCTMLEEGLVPCYDEGETFLYDGAKCHTAKKSMRFLRKKEIKGQLNPPKSPDLNPIENAWAWMAKEVYFDKLGYENVDELKEAIFDAWKAMPQELIDKLIDSMPNRMKKVLDRRGRAIDY
jgi:transposase